MEEKKPEVTEEKSPAPAEASKEKEEVTNPEDRDV